MSGRPEHTQEKLHDEIAAFVDIFLHGKNNFLPQIVFEILKFIKLCNLIGLKHF